MAQTSSEWPVPEGLSPLGQQAAEKIVAFLVKSDATYHGGGGRFYTPDEWADRGESYGRDSLLIVTHDGGAHAGAFNIDYEQYKFHQALQEELRTIGVFSEQCTSWYSAIYAS